MQFSPFPDPPPEFGMILLEGDNYQPIIYEDNGLYEDATTDDSDGQFILLRRGLNTFFYSI